MTPPPQKKIAQEVVLEQQPMVLEPTGNQTPAPEAKPASTSLWTIMANTIKIRPKIIELAVLAIVIYLLSLRGPQSTTTTSLDLVTKTLDKAIRDALLFSTKETSEASMLHPFKLTIPLAPLAPFLERSATLYQRRLFNSSILLCHTCPSTPSDVSVLPPSADCTNVAQDLKGMIFVAHSDVESFKHSTWALYLPPQSTLCFNELVNTTAFNFWYF